MEYFEDDIIIEPDLSQKENEIKPEYIGEENEIKPETVDISKNIINHLKPQENKYWRFSFKNEENTNRLKSVIESIPEYNLTVEFGVPQNTPDIIIKQAENTVGKINLLLCDRRDANLPEKYYCKIYFYHFKNPILYQSIKTAVVNFFESFTNSNMIIKETKGGKRYKKRVTIKRKRIVNKKKTKKRR